MNITKSHTIATGLAMFSMFFGAGNLVFPLAVGHFAQDYNIYAIAGLLLTAVGVPFLGLIAMMLFEGNHQAFFDRIGKIPGFIVALVIMGLLGPFGAIPRCIAFSYSTIKIYVPQISLEAFSAFSCLAILLFTLRQNRVVSILGKILTPVLLLSLGIIIFYGITDAPIMPKAPHGKGEMFWHGLIEGYQTMDLIAAFFFSSIVLNSLKRQIPPSETSNYRYLLNKAFHASVIGAFLLSIIYVGFSFVSALHSTALPSVAPDELIGLIARHILGEKAAIVATLSVALACLTTAIALSAVLAEFLQKDILQNKVGYESALLLILGIAYFVAIRNFTAIAGFLSPILQICYPALIVLAAANILYKLYGFKWVKTPVLVTFLVTLATHFNLF